MDLVVRAAVAFLFVFLLTRVSAGASSPRCSRST